MKKPDSKFEYEDERNDDIMSVYMREINSCREIYLPQIFNNVVNAPSRRFWVSAERAAIVVARMANGDKLVQMRPTKREMFKEIFRRVQKLRKSQPKAALRRLVAQVVEEPAPKFYLTAGSAKVIVYRAKDEWFKRKRRPLKS